MISHKYKCIFIHIPKCGGSSIEHCLINKPYDITETNYKRCYGWDDKNKIWMQHATVEEIKNLYIDKFYEYFRFVITRNPWARSISDYFWMERELKVQDSFKNYLCIFNVTNC